MKKPIERERTTNVRLGRMAYWLLHIGLPIIVGLLCLLQIFVAGQPVEKVKVLSIALLIAVLAIFNIIVKSRMTSLPYLILIALHLTIGNLMPILIIFTTYCFLDDVWFRPRYAHYKRLVEINREIDNAIS